MVAVSAIAGVIGASVERDLCPGGVRYCIEQSRRQAVDDVLAHHVGRAEDYGDLDEATRAKLRQFGDHVPGASHRYA